MQLISKILYKVHSIPGDVEMRTTFLELLQNLVQCKCATFYLGSDDEKHFMDRPVGINIKEHLLYAYTDYEKYDYMNHLFVNSETEVYRETDYFVDEVRKNSPYFQNLLAPNDMYYSIQISLYLSKQFLGVVTLFRGENEEDFSDHDIFLLTLIKDHLALRLYKDSEEKNAPPSTSSNLEKYMDLYDLTKREVEVLQLLFDGLTKDEMADKLNISHFTIQKHTSNIYKKLNISSKNQLLKLYSDVMNK